MNIDLEAAIHRIDAFMANVAGRDLVSTAEVSDALLDIRNDLRRAQGPVLDA